MRRDLLSAAVLLLAACFVGGPDSVDDETETETETETDTDGGTDELGCVGCPCDDQAPCDPGLECDDLCLPIGTRLVPAGPFPRGCDDESCGDDEAPQQMIELSSFAIDEHEVTVADYLVCVTAKQDPCTIPDRSWDGDASPYNFGAPGREQHPVNGVSWDQAAFYCARFGKRLPTEAEWEKAARGREGERYPWGSSAPTCARANLAIGSPGCGADSTIETGQLAGGVSPVGAFDMAGNVAEWVADYYAANYYMTSLGKDPLGPTSGTARVVRGGGWLSSVDEARTSARTFGLEPSAQIGFRCARSIP